MDSYYGPVGSESGRAPLSDSYRTFDMLAQFASFAGMCGAADRLEIAMVSCTDNPERAYLHSAPGAVLTRTGMGPRLRNSRTRGIARKTDERSFPPCLEYPLRSIARQAHLKATFQYNQSNYARTADSQLVHQLRNAAWIPQRDNEFVRPAEASRDLLPDGFPFDPGWPWLDTICFGTATERRAEQPRRTQEIAAELGFPTKLLSPTEGDLRNWHPIPGRESFRSTGGPSTSLRANRATVIEERSRSGKKPGKRLNAQTRSVSGQSPSIATRPRGKGPLPICGTNIPTPTE